MYDCERLKRQTNEYEQHRYKFFLIQQNHFLTQCTLNNIDLENLNVLLHELFKNPIIDFINQEIQRRKGEINNLTSAIVSAP